MITIFPITGKAFNHYSEMEEWWQKAAYVIYFLVISLFLVIADLFLFATHQLREEAIPDLETEFKSLEDLEDHLQKGNISPKEAKNIAAGAISKRHFRVIDLLINHPSIWDRENLTLFLKAAAKNRSLRSFQTAYGKEGLWKILTPNDLYEIATGCNKATLMWLLEKERKKIVIEAGERGNVDFLTRLSLSKEEMDLVAYRASLAGRIDTINWAIREGVSPYFIVYPAIEKDQEKIIKLIGEKFPLIQIVQTAILQKALKILYFLYTKNSFNLLKDTECRQILALFTKKIDTIAPLSDTKENLSRFIFRLAKEKGDENIKKDLLEEGVRSPSCLPWKLHS